MPSEEPPSIYGYPKRGHGHSYITAGGAMGLGLLTVILGVLLLIGCWYCRRRSGYRILKVPNAPPAYEKLSAELSPPPYLP
ncbi:melanoma antigen recognized by T-cells 1 isoform 1-T1 [Hipposideros larvatus]|uniref:Melanoma antigen recognized by T-cells 1 isoform X1 n=1 Tax=Hipposideros armiger TaxID=186990 RepID=A0A8B7T5F6_HIPAR|nr:PREDICTED: melanoma antigen recognized by T-cells 1 isoform X1 [Hipposideros armiger]